MKPLPDRPDPEQLRTQAKELKRALDEGDEGAKQQVLEFHPKFAGRPAKRLGTWPLTLRDSQATVAREYGFESWRDLLEAVEGEKVIRSESRWPPAAMRAFTEARLLGHNFCSGEHLVLAMLSPPEPTVASKVLAEFGIQHEKFAATFKGHARTTKKADDGVGSTPAFQLAVGQARGLAIGMGDRKITDEHLLMAMAFGDSYGGDLLFLHGFDADDLLHALESHGIRVPSVSPGVPKTPSGPWGPWVYYLPKDSLAVHQELLKRFPLGSVYWGTNDSAWKRGYIYIHGEDEIPMEEIVKSAVKDPSTVAVLSFKEGADKESAAREKPGTR